MRDLAVLLVMLAFVPLAFVRPFAGYLLWGWSGLAAIHAYLFGFMADVPYVMLFAVLTLVSLGMKRDAQLIRFEMNRTSAWMLLFVAHGLVVALSAYPGLIRNWELYTNVVKTVMFCLLMPMLLVNRNRFHALVIVIALGASFHGLLDGLKFLASGGSHRAQSLSKFGDNNHLALVLLMALPLLYYLFLYSARAWMRWGFLGVMLVTVLGVVATQSRGGLLGLLAVAAWIVLQGRKKMAGLVVMLAAAGLIVLLAPDSWTQRMETIQAADQDSSFMGRVTAWKVSSAIALAHPFVGGGFRAVQSFEVWDQFKYSPGLLGFIDTPMLSRSGVAAHSVWFEVLGDQGFIGFTIFVALVVNTFVTRNRVRRLVRDHAQDLRWANDLADMVAASMIAFVVSGSLLSAAYFELVYVCMMLMEALHLHLQRQARTQPLQSLPGA